MCHLRSTSLRRGIDSWGSSSAGVGVESTCPHNRFPALSTQRKWSLCHNLPVRMLIGPNLGCPAPQS